MVGLVPLSVLVSASSVSGCHALANVTWRVIEVTWSMAFRHGMLARSGLRSSLRHRPGRCQVVVVVSNLVAACCCRSRGPILVGVATRSARRRALRRQVVGSRKGGRGAAARVVAGICDIAGTRFSGMSVTRGSDSSGSPLPPSPRSPRSLFPSASGLAVSRRAVCAVSLDERSHGMRHTWWLKVRRQMVELVAICLFRDLNGLHISNPTVSRRRLRSARG